MAEETYEFIHRLSKDGREHIVPFKDHVTSTPKAIESVRVAMEVRELGPNQLAIGEMIGIRRVS